MLCYVLTFEGRIRISAESELTGDFEDRGDWEEVKGKSG
jgi:hypothetical protein